MGAQQVREKGTIDKLFKENKNATTKRRKARQKDLEEMTKVLTEIDKINSRGGKYPENIIKDINTRGGRYPDLAQKYK